MPLTAPPTSCGCAVNASTPSTPTTTARAVDGLAEMDAEEVADTDGEAETVGWAGADAVIGAAEDGAGVPDVDGAAVEVAVAVLVVVAVAVLVVVGVEEGVGDVLVVWDEEGADEGVGSGGNTCTARTAAMLTH